MYRIYSSVDKYKYFICHNQVSIFHSIWWLDYVCGKSWEPIVVCDNNDCVLAIFPIYVKKKFNFLIATQPKLTQFLGPILDSKIKIDDKDKLLKFIAGNIKEYIFFQQNFGVNYRYWSPFKWVGYSQTTNYTFILDTEPDLDDIISNFSHGKRSDLKKAYKNKIKVIESNDSKIMYNLLQKTFLRQHINIPYGIDFLDGIVKVSAINKSGQGFMAIDPNGHVHSFIYLIWDGDMVYYLLGGTDPECRNSGASSLLILHGINFAKQKKLPFNFEGSMVEGIASSFRAFNAVPHEYYTISKISNKIVKAIISVIN